MRTGAGVSRGVSWCARESDISKKSPLEDEGVTERFSRAPSYATGAYREQLVVTFPLQLSLRARSVDSSSSMSQTCIRTPETIVAEVRRASCASLDPRAARALARGAPQRRAPPLCAGHRMTSCTRVGRRRSNLKTRVVAPVSQMWKRDGHNPKLQEWAIPLQTRSVSHSHVVAFVTRRSRGYTYKLTQCSKCGTAQPK